LETYRNIPDKLLPLYQSSTAWGVVGAAKKIISETKKEEQMNLLFSNEFWPILNTALINLDQRRAEGIKKLVEVFDLEFQDDIAIELQDFVDSL